MTTKNKSKTKSDTVIQIKAEKEESRNQTIAKMLIKPSLQAAFTIHEWENNSDTVSIMDALSQQIGEVNKGNMNQAEAMLLAQAHTLDALFNNLARRAKNQQYLNQLETNLRLALKAQSQCRTTLETLSAIKNPPVVIAKQANISNGHQQINNGISATRTEKIKNHPNELLEVNNGSETLDTRTTSATIGKDKAMATLN